MYILKFISTQHRSISFNTKIKRGKKSHFDKQVRKLQFLRTKLNEKRGKLINSMEIIANRRNNN